jgi:undecaprenyl-diphosphatase
MNTQLFFVLYNTTLNYPVIKRLGFLVSEYADMSMIVIIGIVLVVFFIHDRDWKQRRWVAWSKEVAIIATAVIFAWFVTFILKIIFQAPRPFVTYLEVIPLVTETPYTSFPSGHATVFFALATVVYSYHKRLGYFFFVCAFLIAISRVVTGVHYPIDILAGAVIGILIAYLSTIFLQKNK